MKKFHNARFEHAASTETFRVSGIGAARDIAAATGRTVVFQPPYVPNHYSGPGEAVAIHPDGTEDSVSILSNPWID